MSSLCGKVIKIISDTEIIIDKGAKDGVEESMKFIIYKEGEMIKHPDTNEEIEKLEIVKGRVIARKVQDKISVCKAPIEYVDNEMANIINFLGRTNAMQRPFQTKLKIDEKDIEQIVSEEDEKIKIGDLVRSIE